MKPDLTHLLVALEFAAHKHRDQRRKDASASPYINHPIALARLLAVEGGVTDVKTLVAAVLHDTIEDTDTSYEELVEHFGRKVADVVAEVTDDKTLPKPRHKALQIEHAPHLSLDAKQIKLGSRTTIAPGENKQVVTALREIAAGFIQADYPEESEE